MHPSQIILLAGATFGLVKACVEFVAWVGAEDKDAIYRRHLDALYDTVSQRNLSDLARHLAAAVITRLGLSEARAFPLVCAVASSLIINYLALLLSFADMARGNANFALNGASLEYSAWALFRELGFLGSQQIVCMSAINSCWSLAAFFLSRRTLMAALTADGGSAFWWSVVKQAGVPLLGFISMLASMWAGVWIYDWGENTETQQYLFGQSVHMLYSYDGRLIGLLMFNSLAACLPCAIYFCLLLLLVVGRAIPRSVGKAITHIVFRLTTDKDPVLKQVGNLLGMFAAVLAVALSLIKGV